MKCYSLQESVEKKQTNKQKSPRNSNESVMQSFPVFCSFVNNGAFVFGSGAWKFNNSVLYNTGFVQKFILKL